MRTQTTACLGAACLLAAGAITSGAQARIVIGQGIAGVKIGDGQARVTKVLGSHHRVVPPTWVYGRTHVGFGHTRHVNDIWTTSRRQRTSRGIGPGASVAAVRRAYPDVRCYRRSRRGPIVACGLRTKHRHRTIKTDFLFDGRLREVDVFLILPRGGTPLRK